MSSVILITFAGRQERMSLMAQYARIALDRGLIHEWHIWDFTRSAEDHTWLNENFGHVRYMSADAHYQTLAKLRAGETQSYKLRIPNDLHLAVTSHARPNEFKEIVVGGWSNSHCACRTMPMQFFNRFERSNEQNEWIRPTAGILTPIEDNNVEISLGTDNLLSVKVNDITLGNWDISDFAVDPKLHIRGGWGGDLEISLSDKRIQRFIGSPGKKMPYSQAYDFYAQRMTAFKEDVFLKCDDDIVYMDIDALEGFIECRRNNPEYFILSANVINNGVCAHLQQLGGSLPSQQLGYFENPPGGFQGELWRSPVRATALHNYFLDLPNKKLPLPQALVTYDARISINFIAWLGTDLKHLALPPGDDEHYISVEVPQLLGRPIAVYSDFVTSHLSFGVQDNGMPIKELLDRYESFLPKA